MERMGGWPAEVAYNNTFSYFIESIAADCEAWASTIIYNSNILLKEVGH